MNSFARLRCRNRQCLLFLPAFLLVVLVWSLPLVAHDDPALTKSVPLTAVEKKWLREHPVVEVAPDPSFPPFEAVDGHGDFKGIFIDFLRLLEAKLPLRFKIVALDNWSVILAKARSREIDMTGAACATPDREEYLHFTRPFLEVPAVVVIRDGGRKFTSMEELGGRKVAVVADYADHEFMRKRYPAIVLEVVPDVVSGLLAVSFAKVDAMILNLASATYFIEQEGITNLRISIDSVYSFKLALATRKDWPVLNSILDKAIATVTPREKEEILGAWVGLQENGWRPDRRTIIGTIVALAGLVFTGILAWNYSLHRRVARKTGALLQELQERQRAEQRLLESQQKFSMLFESGNDAVFVYHPDTVESAGRFIEVNGKATQLTGYSRRELLAMSFGDLVADGDGERLAGMCRIVRERGQALFELTLQSKEGQRIAVEISDRFFIFNGRPTVISMVRDIRNRQRLEEELLKVKKLESIGVLAGGIAHDFNNILAAILGNINVAQHLLGEDHGKVNELLASAEKASLRARDLTQQLLTFAKGGAPFKETASVAEIIRDSADFVLHGTNVAGRYYFSPGLWLAELDKAQISQVVQNVTLNACHAMPDGGTVTVRGENTTLDSSSGLPLAAGRYIKVSLQDTGIGIPDQHLGRIFDPYFSTKDKGSRKGSGLGLALAHSIISRHGGTITVDSTLGEGTTFTFYLPAAEEDRQDGAITEKASRPATGKGRILFMDDEHLVREVASNMLRQLGYEVELAEEGQEAVFRYVEAREQGRPFDLVIMDLTIPGGMGGRDAVREVLKVDPRARVIVTSGYANDPVLADYEKYGFKGVVTKPFLLSQIGRTVQEVLSAREGSPEHNGPGGQEPVSRPG